MGSIELDSRQLSAGIQQPERQACIRLTTSRVFVDRSASASTDNACFTAAWRSAP